MKIITKEEFNQAIQENKKTGKIGSMKKVIASIKELALKNKGNSLRLEPYSKEDLNETEKLILSEYPQGFLVYLPEQIAEDLKFTALVKKADIIKVKKIQKGGNELEVERALAFDLSL